MNMNLRDVICTSRDGDRFWKLPSCYIRGSAINYLRLPPDLLNELHKFKRRRRELEEEAGEGALHEAEEGVDGEVKEFQEAKGMVEEVKGEVGEAQGEGAEVAPEEGGGDRKSRRRGLANVVCSWGILKSRRSDFLMLASTRGAASFVIS